MKMNLENFVRNCGASPGYKATLDQVVTNLRELRDRTAEGDLSALDEFFALYMFGGDTESYSRAEVPEEAPPTKADADLYEIVRQRDEAQSENTLLQAEIGHLAAANELWGDTTQKLEAECDSARQKVLEMFHEAHDAEKNITLLNSFEEAHRALLEWGLVDPDEFRIYG